MTVIFASLAACAAAAGTTVKVSDFGFNPEDSTEIIAAAFASGADRVVFDRQASSWITSKRITFYRRKGLEIVLEQGTVLEAKRGAFLPVGEMLMQFDECSDIRVSGYGAKFLMHREDYVRPPYASSEYRHALTMHSCSNVTIEGLELTQSGGDGIYVGVGGSREPNRNVVIRDCVCSFNHRQGISVISADGLLIENCVLSDTKGLPPEAGIDFEPNHEWEQLKNIVMRNCVTRNNHGRGYELCFAWLTARTEPVSITLENCRSENDLDSVQIDDNIRQLAKDTPKGSVIVRNCTLANARRAAIYLRYKPAPGNSFLLENCTITGCARPGKPDFFLEHPGDYRDPTDGIEFRDVTIVHDTECDWIERKLPAVITAPIRNIDGAITLRGPDGRERKITLGREWCEANFPRTAAEPTFEHSPFAGGEVVDRKPGEAVELSPFTLREIADYAFHAPTAGEYGFEAEMMYLRKDGFSKLYTPLTVTDPVTGETVSKFDLNGGNGPRHIRVSVPRAGFYRMRVPVMQRWTFRLLKSAVPVGLLTDEFPSAVNSSTGSLYFPVKPGERFSLMMAGEPGETVRVRAFDPEGHQEFEVDDLGGNSRFQPAVPKPGLWRVETLRPTHGCMDDYRLDLSGPRSVFFLSPEKYWK